eukprot:SM000037S13527  [mRNA]  locus=s37:386306:389917:+ [translate_table: standard]
MSSDLEYRHWQQADRSRTSEGTGRRTDGRDGRHDLAELELIKDRGLSGRIKTDHEDAHLLLREEALVAAAAGGGVLARESERVWAGLMALQRLESVDNHRKLDERRTLIRSKSSFRGNEENFDSNLARPELLPVPHKPQCVPRSNAEGESTQAAPVEYMPTENLQPVEDAQACLNTLLQRLSSKNWFVVCHALVNVRQLSIFHSLAFRLQLKSVIPSILRSMQSPRSVLCKTAIMVTSDLLAAYADEMLVYIDQILPHLLMKASQDKQFVCEEAARTLQSMTTALSPGPLLMKLQHLVQHRNPRVRAKATVAIQQTASKLVRFMHIQTGNGTKSSCQQGADGLAKWGLDALVKLAGAQIADQLPEAREAARKLTLDLFQASKNLQEHASVDESMLDGSSLNGTGQNWEQLCRRMLPVTAAMALIDLTCTTCIQEPTTSAVSVLGES